MSTGGLSQARLGRMHGVIAGYAQRAEVPGIVTLVGRRDEVHVDAIGMKAVGGNDPMRRATIFRIASLTSHQSFFQAGWKAKNVGHPWDGDTFTDP